MYFTGFWFLGTLINYNVYIFRNDLYLFTCSPEIKLIFIIFFAQSPPSLIEKLELIQV